MPGSPWPTAVTFWVRCIVTSQEEFVLRREVLPAIDVIRSATVNAARLLGMEGKIGVIAPGAKADMIVVDGDPLKDISLLTRQGAHLMMIMKNGRTVKSELN